MVWRRTPLARSYRRSNLALTLLARDRRVVEVLLTQILYRRALTTVLRQAGLQRKSALRIWRALVFSPNPVRIPSRTPP